MKKFIAVLLNAALIVSVSNSVSAGEHGHKETHMSAQKNIVATAVAAGDFKTLAAALKATELDTVLMGKGPFTVFAPTDAAFAKLPKGTVESLLKDKEKLKSILLYHVVPGKVTAKDVVKLKTAKTVQGKNIAIKIKDKQVYINGAKVIKADILTSNGVIHVIDEVILPPM